ncbi:MAG: Holliday junction branch migration protein RuvA [Chitinophagales bacterium]
MIAYLKGNIIARNPASVILDVNGIGYLINITLHTYTLIQNKNECLLYCYHYYREDGQSMIPVIYGFAEEQERNMFTHLLSVNGVGANTARMMLSSMSVAELEQAILIENDKLIQSIKGVGPKTAKKIVIELKDKIGKTTSGSFTTVSAANNTYRDEALSALAMLGFNRQSAEKAIALALQSNSKISSSEELVKTALKNL